MPKWIAGTDTLKPGKALGLGLLLAGVNPKSSSQRLPSLFVGPYASRFTASEHGNIIQMG